MVDWADANLKGVSMDELWKPFVCDRNIGGPAHL